MSGAQGLLQAPESFFFLNPDSNYIEKTSNRKAHPQANCFDFDSSGFFLFYKCGRDGLSLVLQNIC